MQQVLQPSLSQGQEKNECSSDEVRLEESWDERVERQRCDAPSFWVPRTQNPRIQVALGWGWQRNTKWVQRSEKRVQSQLARLT
jgi:hypothetical protein